MNSGGQRVDCYGQNCVSPKFISPTLQPPSECDSNWRWVFEEEIKVNRGHMGGP